MRCRVCEAIGFPREKELYVHRWGGLLTTELEHAELWVEEDPGETDDEGARRLSEIARKIVAESKT